MPKRKLPPGIKEEFEAAVLAEVERLGPDGVSKDAIVRRFSDRDVGRSTLYRWAEAILASGKPGQHVARKVKEAAAERAARTAEPVKEIVAEIAAKLPVRVSVDDTLRGGAGTPKVIERLNSIVAELDGLMAHAKTPDGKIRNARLVLAAAKELRGCVDTGLRLFQAMRDVDQTDRLQDAILDEIAKLSPETAEAIYRRIDQIAQQWGG